MDRAIAAAGKFRKRLAQARERFESSVAAHFKHRDDPEVLVRNYNETTIEVYHADRWCGWANPDRSRWILLSTARRRGYRPCVSCGYRVKEQVAA